MDWSSSFFVKMKMRGYEKSIDTVNGDLVC